MPQYVLGMMEIVLGMYVCRAGTGGRLGRGDKTTIPCEKRDRQGRVADRHKEKELYTGISLIGRVGSTAAAANADGLQRGCGRKK